MVKQSILSAENDYRALDIWLAENRITKLLLVCDGALRFLSIRNYFAELPERLGVGVVKFDDFQPNPLYESVVEGVALFHQEQCEAIIAVGGGSAMDVAKCIKLYSNMDSSRNYLEQPIVPNDVKLLAIPTTAGTGSEATRYAVIYYNGVKQSVADESCIPSAVLMDSNAADKIQILSRETREMSAGTRYFELPAYKMLVHKSLGLKEGGWLIMEASDELPSGGVFKVVSLESFPGFDYDRVALEPETNPVQAYDHLSFGGTIWKENGELVEDAGQSFNLGAYLSGIQDADGNSVPFTVSPSGEILFTEEATEQLLGTRGLVRKDFSVTTPSISHQIGEDGCSLTLGASMTISMKAAARIEQGELSFLHFTVHPVLNLSANFTLSKEWSKSWEKSLITLYFVPGVPIAPGLVMEPNINFSASVGVSADIKFTADMTYSYDCGTFGCSYNAGDGFFLRYQKAEPGSVQMAPEFDFNFYANFSAGVHLGINPALHIWGLMEVGIDTDLSLTLSLGGDMKEGIKMALTPGLSLTPRTAALG